MWPGVTRSTVHVNTGDVSFRLTSVVILLHVRYLIARSYLTSYLTALKTAPAHVTFSVTSRWISVPVQTQPHAPRTFTAILLLKKMNRASLIHVCSRICLKHVIWIILNHVASFITLFFYRNFTWLLQTRNSSQIHKQITASSHPFNYQKPGCAFVRSLIHHLSHADGSLCGKYGLRSWRSWSRTPLHRPWGTGRSGRRCSPARSWF